MAWVPLESNPEVMNKYIHKLGVPKNFQIVDVYSLDPDMLAIIPQPVLALILLFPYDPKYLEHKNQQEEDLKKCGQVITEKIFFLKQVVHNACGTIALIHSIANNHSIVLEDGFLKSFLDEALPLTPEQRGDLLQKADGMIDTHKELAAEGQTAPPDENEPVPYHFVAFIEKEGSLYEMDGRKSFPVNHGASAPATFLDDAANACRQYMNRDPDNVNFTIVALTSE